MPIESMPSRATSHAQVPLPQAAASGHTGNPALTSRSPLGRPPTRSSAGTTGVAPRAALPTPARAGREVAAVDIRSFQLAAAMATEAGLPSHAAPPAPEAPDSRTADRRAILECMRVFAEQAYSSNGDKITEVAGFQPVGQASTDVMKIWQGESPDTLNIVLAFAGTRSSDKGDMARDVQSQVPSPHVNPLDPGLPSLGHVGMGWRKRWTRQAQVRLDGGLPLGDMLALRAAQAQAQGKPLLVNVTGHSLGAATATVAGYDIANFLHSRSVLSQTQVVVFNPPRMGSVGAEVRYQQALLAGSHAGMGSGPGPSLQLHQFTRALDPVQSVPLFMHHPTWHKPSGLSARSANNPELVGLAQDSNYHATAVDRVNLGANHHLGAWKSTIAVDMPDTHVDRMFRGAPLRESA